VPKILLGIISCGDTQNAQQLIFNKLNERDVVTGTCDIEIDRATRATNDLGAIHVATNYLDLFSFVDALLIATLYNLHH
jgi:predicted dehydrogenase